MKRVVILLTAAALLLAACAKNVEPDEEMTEAVIQEATQAPTESPTEPPTEPPTLDELAQAKFDALLSGGLGTERRQLDRMEARNQVYSGLQAACEALALTAALGHFGYDLEDDDIVDDYMVYSSDFITGYCGNPRRFYDGAGIYPPGMVTTAWNFINDRKADLYPFDTTGTSLKELYKLVEAGCPVLIWTTYDRYSPRIEMYREYNGVNYPWYETEHCVCLCGYDTDAGQVYIADSWYGTVDWEDASNFERVYNEVGKFSMALMSTEDLK